MDKEKVIEAFNDAKELVWLDDDEYTIGYNNGIEAGKNITLALLKDQEAVKPVLDEQTGRIWLCGKCGSYVGFEDNDPYDPNEYDTYCRECGRPVLWEGRKS